MKDIASDDDDGDFSKFMSYYLFYNKQIVTSSDLNKSEKRQNFTWATIY